MDFPTICKKFYYCLHQTTLYVKVILLKACFKYEKAYIKNRFFKDFTGRVHLHVSEQRHYETARKSRHSRELRQNGRRRSQEPITATARRLNTGGGDGDHSMIDRN